jgi:epoxyqueuosine reductase
LKKKYLKALPHIPEYIKKSLDERVAPVEKFPWAESVLIAAIPFSNIPKYEPFISEATDSDALYGLIAPYATRLDYHLFAKQLLNNIIEDFKNLSHDKSIENLQSFKYEPCVDTKPIAEKALASYSNVGQFGKNQLIQTQNFSSDTFLIELFTNVKIPDIKEKSFFLKCNSCDKCSLSCPSGALHNYEFDYTRCISAITMEKRGILSPKERKLIAPWIFGCNICSSACPGSPVDEPFKADLRWLLTSSASDVKHHIIGTPLNYAGVTLLRRNALAVLESIGTSDAFDLIQFFSEKTQSSVLKISAEEILHKKQSS